MPLEELTRELVEAIARQHPTLQRLTLARNALRELRFLELLPPLRRLDLSDNRLRALPPEIAQWGRALEFLDLTGNALESLQQLRVCGELQTLRVGGNQIALYSELKYLQPLQQLRDLTLEHNPIADASLYRREVVAMLPQLTTLDGRAVSQGERLVATLQQKPQLTITTDAQQSPALQAHGEEDEEVGDEGKPGLDLSDASSVAWSSGMPLGGLTSPQSVRSPASSIAPSAKSPAARRTLLTPATLRLSTGERTARRAVGTVNVATQAEARRRIEDERRSLSEDAVSSSHAMVKTTVAPPPVESESETLLRSRVGALENILSLQDRMLQDGLTQTAKHQESATEDPEKAARVYTELLAAWRHKVVSLMVQIKSMELQKPTASAATGTQQAVEAASAVAAELELWKQKYNDALAQRDLERVRVEQTQRQCENAESKIVRVVRTLATERERVRGVAEEVAVFAAKEGAMTTQLDTLAHATRRLHAYETRLRLLSERVGHASRLVAHREARLRNSEAAIEAERRMWNHKMAASSRAEYTEDTNEGEMRIPGSGKPAFLLRPATEQALRLLFHRLDPYGTGLVSTRTLMDALRSDSGVREALGRSGRGRNGESKLSKIVDHIEAGLRERSSFGGLGGNVTWGELLLLFMPTVVSEDGDAVQDVTTHGLSVDELELPPRFEDVDQPKKPTTTVSKRDKLALQSLTKHELINEVVALRDERLQLQRRVLEDAQRLQRRAQWIQKQWANKTKELTETNEDLHKILRKQTQQSSEFERKLQEAERVSGEAQYQLQSLRRQLSEQAAQFASQKDELEAKCVAGVEREQQVWQREVQDMAFQQTQLQTENAKLDLCVRQLEREIAKQRDQREQSESAKVQHLEEKLRKRDDELARLRRERNTILNALRDHEHKLAELTAQKAASSQAHVGTQTTPLSKTSHSVAVQTAASSIKPPPSDRRMSLEDISPRATEKQAPRALLKAAPTTGRAVSATSVSPQDLHKRLQHLESLTESLLAD